MQPIAVILDFDGVIVDSLTAHLQAWSRAVERIFCRQLEDPHRIARHSTQAISHILAQKYGHPSLASSLAKTKEQILIEGLIPVPLLGNVLGFIERAHALNIPIGIASNSTSAYVRSILTHHNLISYLQSIVCGDEVRYPKPAPDIFWKCANQLRVAIESRRNIFVFEDSSHGVEAATAADMIAIGITSIESDSVLRARGAVRTYEDLGAAIPLLSGLNL